MPNTNRLRSYANGGGWLLAFALMGWCVALVGCSAIYPFDEPPPFDAGSEAATPDASLDQSGDAPTPDAVVEVKLLDVSLADTSAIVLAEQTIRPKHHVPIPFVLTYEPAVIDDRMFYAVRATIRDREQLLFTTDRSYRVLTRGQPNHIDLVLVRTSN